jgi:hypothetical protein
MEPSWGTIAAVCESPRPRSNLKNSSTDFTDFTDASVGRTRASLVAAHSSV